MSTVCCDENERLVAEQAVLVYRSVIDAMETAPHGQGMACMEDAVLLNGRAHLRQMCCNARQPPTPKPKMLGDKWPSLSINVPGGVTTALIGHATVFGSNRAGP